MLWLKVNVLVKGALLSRVTRERIEAKQWEDYLIGWDRSGVTMGSLKTLSNRDGIPILKIRRYHDLFIIIMKIWYLYFIY